MRKIRNYIKEMFLDMFAMGKGFVYGFVMVGLFVILGGGLIVGILYLKNLIF